MLIHLRFTSRNIRNRKSSHISNASLGPFVTAKTFTTSLKFMLLELAKCSSLIPEIRPVLIMGAGGGGVLLRQISLLLTYSIILLRSL